MGRWSRSFTVLAPVDSDLLNPVLAVSAQGRVAVGSGTTNEDEPQSAHAEILTAGGGDAFAKQGLAQIQQTLAVGYLGSRLVLLNGSSPSSDACCSAASAVTLGSGRTLGDADQFATGLEGTTTGALVGVQGGLLAVVDNQSGITVARSDATGSFSSSEVLAASDPTPPLMAASSLNDGGAVVVWTAPEATAQTVTGTTTAPGSSTTASGYDQPANQLIYYALDAPAGLPGQAKLAVRVPAGREINSVAVTAHQNGATLAWTESWFADARYYSEVFWADLKPSARVRELSSAATAAVGVSLASGPKGREVLAWQACNVAGGTCTTSAALRPGGGAWGPVRVLGRDDATGFPVATESSLGQALVGWVSDGYVDARAAKPGASRFYPTARVAALNDDYDLALGFGAGQQAFAVWVQGTVEQKLVGARFTP